MINGRNILDSSADQETRTDGALQVFLPLSTLSEAVQHDESVDEAKESWKMFTRYHALTCLLGFLVLFFSSLIALTGMFINVRPFNCTAEEADDDLLSDLPWSEHQGFRSSLSQQYKLCNKATGDLTNVAVLAGTIVGSLIVGAASDRFGRKPCILAGLVLTAIASLAGNYAPSFWLHLACRGLAGCCMMFCQCAIQVYGSEVHSLKHQGRYLASWSAGVCVGTLASGVLAYLARDHQLFVLVTCCVPAAPLLLALRLPESPAWLAARGFMDDSEAALRRIDVINGRRLTRPLPAVADSPSPMSSESRSSGCSSDWNCRLVRLACLLGFHGVCVGLNCYGFYFVMSGVIPDVCLYAVLIGSSQLPSIFLFNLVPRRSGLLISSLLSGLISLGFGAAVHFLPTKETSGAGGVSGALRAGLGVVGSFCSVIAFNLIVSVSAESFPISIRNTGLGLCTFCLRCGSTFAPLINFLPGAAVQSLALGGPLLLSCLPMGLALCGCGCQLFNDNEEEGQVRKASGKEVIQIGNSQIEFDMKV